MHGFIADEAIRFIKTRSICFRAKDGELLGADPASGRVFTIPSVPRGWIEIRKSKYSCPPLSVNLFVHRTDETEDCLDVYRIVYPEQEWEFRKAVQEHHSIVRLGVPELRARECTFGEYGHALAYGYKFDELINCTRFSRPKDILLGYRIFRDKSCIPLYSDPSDNRRLFVKRDARLLPMDRHAETDKSIRKRVPEWFLPQQFFDCSDAESIHPYRCRTKWPRHRLERYLGNVPRYYHREIFKNDPKNPKNLGPETRRAILEVFGNSALSDYHHKPIPLDTTDDFRRMMRLSVRKENQSRTKELLARYVPVAEAAEREAVAHVRKVYPRLALRHRKTVGPMIAVRIESNIVFLRLGRRNIKAQWMLERCTIHDLTTGKRVALMKSGEAHFHPIVSWKSTRETIAVDSFERLFEGTVLGKAMDRFGPNFIRCEKKMPGKRPQENERIFDGIFIHALERGKRTWFEQFVGLGLAYCARAMVDGFFRNNTRIPEAWERNLNRAGFRIWPPESICRIIARYALPGRVTSLPKAFCMTIEQIRILNDEILRALYENRPKEVSLAAMSPGIPLEAVRRFLQIDWRDLGTERFRRLLKAISNLTDASIHPWSPNYRIRSTIEDLILVTGLELPKRNRFSVFNSFFTGGRPQETLQLLVDYSRIQSISRHVSNEIGRPFDLTKFPVLPKPSDLRRKHDLLVALDVEPFGMHELDISLAELEKQYAKGPRKKAVKMEYAEGPYAIVAPRTLTELDEEGRMLHHCVGSYKESVAMGQETILFLRKTEKPTVPWFTLDVDSYRCLRQIHTAHNGNLEDVPERKTIRRFLRKWASARNIQGIGAPGTTRCLTALDPADSNRIQ